MDNPEDEVIADIDALIDEQLQIGPVDDYNVDRYDRCHRCGDTWHGLKNYLGCPGSDVEGPLHVGKAELMPFQQRCGYTIADLRAMQGQNWRLREDRLGPYAYREHFTEAGVGNGPTVELDSSVELYRGPATFYSASGPVSAEIVIGGGREPAWLIELVDRTVAYVQETLSALMGLDPAQIEALLPELQNAAQERTQGQERGNENQGTTHVEPLWRLAATNTWQIGDEIVTGLPIEESFDSRDCEGPF